MGDFNARTGKNVDYIENDSNFPLSDESLLPQSYTIDIQKARYNTDKIVNKQAKLLLETCIEFQLRILNGRLIGDSVGNFTYFDHLGGCSIIDYMIASEKFLDNILYFNVMPQIETSGQCVIRCCLPI